MKKIIYPPPPMNGFFSGRAHSMSEANVKKKVPPEVLFIAIYTFNKILNWNIHVMKWYD